MRCLLSAGLPQGQKQKVTNDKYQVGPSSKKVRAALPRLGLTLGGDQEWRQCIVDALEVVNAEC